MDTSTHLMVDAVSICIGGLLGAFMAWLFDRERAKRYKARDESYARQRAELKAEREKLAKWRDQLRGSADDAHIIAHTAVELADTDPRVRAINDWPEPADIEDNADTVVWGYDPAGGMELAPLAHARPADMSLGEDAQQRGARADEIPPVPGLFRVTDERGVETVVRMPLVTDDDLRQLAESDE